MFDVKSLKWYALPLSTVQNAYFFPVRSSSCSFSLSLALTVSSYFLRLTWTGVLCFIIYHVRSHHLKLPANEENSQLKKRNILHLFSKSWVVAVVVSAWHVFHASVREIHVRAIFHASCIMRCSQLANDERSVSEVTSAPNSIKNNFHSFCCILSTDDIKSHDRI